MRLFLNSIAAILLAVTGGIIMYEGVPLFLNQEGLLPALVLGALSVACIYASIVLYVLNQALKLRVKKESCGPTTKICPACGNTKLVLLTSLNVKLCPECHNTIPWKLEKDQPSLLTKQKG